MKPDGKEVSRKLTTQGSPTCARFQCVTVTFPHFVCCMQPFQECDAHHAQARRRPGPKNVVGAVLGGYFQTPLLLLRVSSPPWLPSRILHTPIMATAESPVPPPAPVPVTTAMSKYKLVFLGDQGVGKTSIIKSFLYGVFDTTYQVRGRCGTRPLRRPELLGPFSCLSFPSCR